MTSGKNIQFGTPSIPSGLTSIGNGVSFRFFFILLLRPSNTFFSNQLYDKVPRELNSWFPHHTYGSPRNGRRAIHKYPNLLPFLPLSPPYSASLLHPRSPATAFPHGQGFFDGLCTKGLTLKSWPMWHWRQKWVRFG
jgi:hypothetical protein